MNIVIKYFVGLLSHINYSGNTIYFQITNQNTYIFFKTKSIF